MFFAAALSAKGAGRELLRQGIRGEFNLCISSDVLEETERNLSKKAPQALDVFHSLRDLLPLDVVNPRKSLVQAAAGVVAAKDAPIVAAAVEAGVAYLATYDRKHLLSQRDEVQRKFGVTIALPDEILTVKE